MGWGADDYITKPFSVTEVLARIKANIRRTTQYASGISMQQPVLIKGALTMDLNAYCVKKDGKEIELTAKEFEILKLLLQNPKKVYTKEQIYSLVWNDAYLGDENAVNVHISRLRTKIEDDPRNPGYMVTVWGIGYKAGERRGNDIYHETYGVIGGLFPETDRGGGKIMLKLMKLEWKKNNIGKYIRTAVILTALFEFLWGRFSALFLFRSKIEFPVVFNSRYAIIEYLSVKEQAANTHLQGDLS